MTPAQRNKIMADARKAGWDENDIKAYIHQTFGVTSSREMTMAQAGQMIDMLIALNTPPADTEQPTIWGPGEEPM